MIEIKNLTKKFGATVVLDSLSLQVNRGEILGFLGPNGAGKTTTMKIITSFWTPSRGSVTIDGRDTVADSIETRKRIGYLPETVPLYDDMRVYEYLRFVAEVRGLSPEDMKRRIKEVVEACGLKAVIRKPIEELSKGYRQRVSPRRSCTIPTS
jgi:ABC-2 type transport system ATP-binding protein